MSEEEQIFSKRATPPFDDETVQLAMLKMKQKKKFYNN